MTSALQSSPASPPHPYYQQLEERVLDRDQRGASDLWLPLVERGQVIEAYRVFLGIVGEPAHREQALTQLVFAGLIDVQDRMLYNRSYTSGHKANRARAVVELSAAVGWDQSHPIL